MRSGAGYWIENEMEAQLVATIVQQGQEVQTTVLSVIKSICLQVLTPGSKFKQQKTSEWSEISNVSLQTDQDKSISL